MAGAAACHAGPAILAILTRCALVELGARAAVIAVAVGGEDARVEALAPARRRGWRVAVKMPWRAGRRRLHSKDAARAHAAVVTIGARGAAGVLRALAAIVALAV